MYKVNLKIYTLTNYINKLKKWYVKEIRDSKTVRKMVYRVNVLTMSF